MTGNATQIIRWLTEQNPKEVWEIKKHRQKRSLDSNNFYWKIVTDIADVQNTSKNEVHNILLRRYGQPEGVDGRLVEVYLPDTEKAAKSALMAEEYHLKPTSYVKIGSKGQTFRAYVLLRGSRTYDSREMSILIKGALDEAEHSGIKIELTPAELERYGIEKHSTV